MNQRIINLKSQLATQHFFMNDNWLTECVEYYINEERQGATVKDGEILDFVKEQWMLGDLREINNIKGSLPGNIGKKKFFTIPGNHILQVDQFYDISVPKFKQLENIRKVSNINIEVTEQNENNYRSEPKAKRMLYLYLTDGIQDLTAMEYKLIPCLLPDRLIPGYKLLIRGPILCRNGVMMLEPKNIPEMLLGGEIESLLIKNATENVLARALGLPENPDPYGDNNPQPEVKNMDVDKKENVSREGDRENHSGNLDNFQNLDRSMSNLSMEILDAGAENTKIIAGGSRDFDDDCDEWMSMIDESQLNVVGVKTNTFDQARGIEKGKIVEKSPIISRSNSDMFDDFVLDEDVIEKVERSENIETTSSYFNNLKPSNIVDLTEESPKQVTKTIDKSPSYEILQDSLNIDFPEIDMDTLMEIENAEFGEKNKSKETKPVKISQDKRECIKSINYPIFNKNPSATVTPIKSPIPQKKSPIINLGKITSKISKVNTNSTNKKITNFFVKKDEKPVINLREQYDTIADINASMPTNVLKKMTIFGRISAIRKLKKEKMAWDLNVIIDDGKERMEVKFSNEVLEKIIGYSVMNFVTLRMQGPEMKEMLRTALQQADANVTKFKGLFDIELLPHENFPKVTKLTPMTK